MAHQPRFKPSDQVKAARRLRAAAATVDHDDPDLADLFDAIATACEDLAYTTEIPFGEGLRWASVVGFAGKLAERKLIESAGEVARLKSIKSEVDHA